jgi:hypothetical protein
MVGAGIGRPRPPAAAPGGSPKPSPGPASRGAPGSGGAGRWIAVAAVAGGALLARQLWTGAALDVQAVEQFAQAAQMGWRVQPAAALTDCLPERCFGAAPPPGLTASAEGQPEGPTLLVWDGEVLVAEASFSRDGALRWTQRPGG